MKTPTKVCNKCKERRPLDQFHINRSSMDGLRNDCKQCRATPSDGFYSVYYLPEHNYVGMTKHIKSRMQHHRKKGKVTEGYEIIGTFDTAVEAHYIETAMHLRGYEGFHYYETQRRKVG